jgi:hypothetical protein
VGVPGPVVLLCGGTDSDTTARTPLCPFWRG